MLNRKELSPLQAFDAKRPVTCISIQGSTTNVTCSNIFFFLLTLRPKQKRRSTRGIFCHHAVAFSPCSTASNIQTESQRKPLGRSDCILTRAASNDHHLDGQRLAAHRPRWGLPQSAQMIYCQERSDAIDKGNQGEKICI